MSIKESLSDEYVAGILKKDARESTIKYSALGMEAMLPKRPTIAAPKPNTRFLKNIIRETDNHNAALKFKELGDAAHKLRGLRKSVRDDERHEHRLEREDVEYDARKSRSEDSGGHHGRHARESASRLSPPDETDRKRRKRRRDSVASDTGEEDDRRERRRHRDTRHKTHDREKRRDSIASDTDEEGDRRERRRHRDERHKAHDRERRRDRSRSRSRSPHRHSRPRHRRNSSPEMDIDKAFVKARRHQTKTLNSRSHSSKAADQDDAAEFSKPISRKELEHTVPTNEEDSDPLDAIIGPALPQPPPRVLPRGRGALAASSGIDSRFSGSYDPSTDVRLDEADDDWDQALEALKDRQRWKQQGADRLRVAGFTEDEIDKWQTGGEKTEEDVKWKKKGEGREWDRGKVVNEEGQVELEPVEWGRLKGT